VEIIIVWHKVKQEYCFLGVEVLNLTKVSSVMEIIKIFRN